MVYRTKCNNCKKLNILDFSKIKDDKVNCYSCNFHIGNMEKCPIESHNDIKRFYKINSMKEKQCSMCIKIEIDEDRRKHKREKNKERKESQKRFLNRTLKEQLINYIHCGTPMNVDPKEYFNDNEFIQLRFELDVEEFSAFPSKKHYDSVIREFKHLRTDKVESKDYIKEYYYDGMARFEPDLDYYSRIVYTRKPLDHCIIKK
jgi:hypothetical protein